MRLSPTRASRPPDAHVLVYDGDCPFCTATARWTQRHARAELRLLTFEDVEDTGLLTRLTHEELVSAAHYITPAGIEYHRGEAITRVLRLVPLGRLVAILDLPGLTLLRDLGYALTAHLRPLLSKYIHP